MIREIFEEATALQRQGDLDGAIARYRRCLELDPARTLVRHNLCIALLTGKLCLSKFFFFSADLVTKLLTLLCTEPRCEAICNA